MMNCLLQTFKKIKVKGKMCKSVVRPTMLYEMETVAVTEKQVEKMEVVS